MQTCVAFKSALFRPFLPESAQVNPNCYGAELAWWLAGQFALRGFVTSYPNNEDWGWFIEYVVDECEYWLCCSNLMGEPDRWQVYLDCKPRSLFGRNKAPVECAADLIKALAELLIQTEGIEEISWHHAPH